MSALRTTCVLLATALSSALIASRAPTAPRPAPAPPARAHVAPRITRPAPRTPPPAPPVTSPARPTLARASRVIAAPRCASLASPDARGHFIARVDLAPPLAPVDGDDLLALVDRSARFGLAPEYAPRDLVDVDTMRPATVAECEPPGGQCLRRDAALALRAMLSAMREAGVPGHVHSAFRAFDAQCGVFRRWSVGESQGMCVASTASALAGHSQHQLGTALDLFTAAWARGGPVMRAGYGCTEGGRWLAAHAREFGFVLPYPLPLDEREAGSTCARRRGAGDEVDPRTGYRYEPWHLRYIGPENARRFHAALAEHGEGTEREITLAQWLRARVGIDGDADLPVCDGCACGACTTFARDALSAAPCGDRALVLDARGEPVAMTAPPQITAVRAVTEGAHTRVTVDLRLGAHTVTQPPVLNAPGARERYDELAGAWRLSLESASGAGFSMRVALLNAPGARGLNGANQRLPAGQGPLRLTVETPRTDALRVGLAHDGAIGDVRELRVE